MALTHLPFRASKAQHIQINRIYELADVDKSFVLRYLIDEGLRVFSERKYLKAVQSHKEQKEPYAGPIAK